MDTSDKYIDMCEKSVDIQKLWVSCEGDYVFVEYPEDYAGNDGIKVVFEDHGHNKDGLFFDYDNEQYYPDAEPLISPYCKKKIIWLPRQDQLQEILDDKNPHRFLLQFIKFSKPAMGKTIETHVELGLMKQKTSYIYKLSSMEKLWLTFVMKEKFNKTWNNDNWV